MMGDELLPSSEFPSFVDIVDYYILKQADGALVSKVTISCGNAEKGKRYLL